MVDHLALVDLLGQVDNRKQEDKPQNKDKHHAADVLKNVTKNVLRIIKHDVALNIDVIRCVRKSVVHADVLKKAVIRYVLGFVVSTVPRRVNALKDPPAIQPALDVLMV